LDKKDTHSHTKIMYTVADDSLDITLAGPHFGSQSELVKYSLQDRKHPTVLIAGGSGINFVLDVLQYPVSTKVVVLFATRDAKFFAWVQKALLAVLSTRGKEQVDLLRVVLSYTGKDDRNDKLIGSDMEQPASIITCIEERLNFENEILPSSSVYCQGSQALKDSVAEFCLKKKAYFYVGSGH
jgi:ferredoxin-NADP reductase